jgi:hypothetical protein
MVRYLGYLLNASTAFWLGTMGLTVRHVPNLDTELHSWLSDIRQVDGSSACARG